MARGKAYAPEFRREAVRLFRVSGGSMREVAADLGVALESLRGWALQADVDGGRRQGLTSDEREELRDRELLRLIKRIHDDSRGTYGCRASRRSSRMTTASGSPVSEWPS